MGKGQQNPFMDTYWFYSLSWVQHYVNLTLVFLGRSLLQRFEDILLRVARYWQLEFSLFFKFSSSVVWEMDFMDMNSNMTKQIQSYCFSPA